MAGTTKGSMKKRLGLKGKTKPGEMISAMNKSKSSFHKPKPTGKGIVKALHQKGTTGNFKRIEEAKGKGAAIGALQNKLAKIRHKPIPYGGKKK